MATKAKRSVSAPRRPEKKWGPFAGGCGVAVWLNEVQTAAGPRFFRSDSLQPRRYRDILGWLRDVDSDASWETPGLYLDRDLRISPE